MRKARIPAAAAAAHENRICRAIEAWSLNPLTKYPRSWWDLVGGLRMHCRVERHVAADPVDGDPTQCDLLITGALEAASADDAAMAKLTKPDRDAIRALVASAPPEQSLRVTDPVIPAIATRQDVFTPEPTPHV